MDILGDVTGVETSPVALEDLVEIKALPDLPPDASMRNKAATTALVANEPYNILANYSKIYGEAREGKDQYYRQLNEKIQNEARNQNLKTTLQILGDPTTDPDKAKSIIEGVKDNPYLKDKLSQLQEKSLAAPSKGETVAQERARISTADALNELYDSRVKIQGLVNAHGAGLDDAGIKTVVDMASLYMLPGAEGWSSSGLNREFKERTGRSTSFWQQVKDFILPGSAKKDMVDYLNSVPPEQRHVVAKQLVDSIKAHRNVIFSSDNQFEEFDRVTNLLGEGGYSSTQEWIDNIASLLDIVGIGFLAKGAATAGKASKIEPTIVKARRPGSAAEGATDVWVNERPFAPKIDSGIKRLPAPESKIEDTVKRIEMNQTIARENPASPAKTVQQVNPEHARAFHEAIVTGNDEVAQALYGTTRDQAIISDVFPQAATKENTVFAKVPDIDRNVRIKENMNPEVLDAIYNSGGTYYELAEKEAAIASIKSQWESSGMHMNQAMSSFNQDGAGVRISAVFGTNEGGFHSVEDAKKMAQYHLRKWGISEKDIEIVGRDGLEYSNVELLGKNGEVLAGSGGRDGSYYVRVNTFHEFDPTDITHFNSLDVKLNFFDRVPVLANNPFQLSASVSRHIFDASSMIHPTYTGAASVAADRTSYMAKLLLGEAEKFATQFKPLSNERKAKVDAYLKEANFKEIPYNRGDLIARGFNHSEIEAIKSWRDYWDGMFYLENLDIVRSTKAEGYQLLENAAGDRFIAKQVPKNSNINVAYDPAHGIKNFFTVRDIEALHDSGGYMAKFKRPITINGEQLEYMVVRNTPNEYLRGLRDTDQLLNYKEGYFQIQYKKNSRFIDEKLPDGTYRTVAVAGDTAEAEAFITQLKYTRGGEYEVRGDTRAMRQGDNTYWDLHTAQGRIAQRHRGKTLEDATGFNHLGDADYIVNPVDSAIKAANSVSGRTVTRPMFDAIKARFMSEYDEFIPRIEGVKQFPSRITDLVEKGNPTSSRLADARTVYGHIKYLENGYMNTADEAFKGLMNAMANIMGSLHGKGIDTLGAEKMFYRLSETSPVSLAKNATFMTYIGLHPLRQLIVQPHQVMRTLMYNPQGWINGKIPSYVADYLMHKAGTLQVYTKEAQAFIDFVEHSGALASVDKHNLIRGSLADMAFDASLAKKLVKSPFELSRKLGFEMGEQANLLGHFAAVYERWVRNGKDLTNKHTRDLAYSEARAISYDMNFSGDMPYNQNYLNVALQFFQVPHKAMLQASNRRIPWPIRARMVAGDVLMWGAPVGAVGTLLSRSVLPEDENLRDIVQFGVESWAVNTSLTKMYGEQVNIDLSSLAPYDLTGWREFFLAMNEGGLTKVLHNSPAGNLFLKDGNRFHNAMRTLGRFFGSFDDVDPNRPDFTAVVNEVGKIASGWNAASKAYLMLELKKKVDSRGAVLDEHTNAVEAIAQLFGFQTATARDLYQMSKDINSSKKDFEEEVVRQYRDMMNYYSSTLGKENTDVEFRQKVAGFVWKMYADNPKAQEIIMKELRKDLMSPNDKMMKMMLDAAQIPNEETMRDTFLKAPISKEHKEQGLKLLEDMNKIRMEHLKNRNNKGE